jgi:hypothetical protein
MRISPSLLIVLTACAGYVDDKTDAATPTKDAGKEAASADASNDAIESGSPLDATPADTGPAADDTAAQLCVDTINQYRATLGLAPYQRWKSNEACTDGQALTDSQSGTPHSAFGKCGEYAQNECPGWPAPAVAMIPQCLAAMWAEGPGDFAHHGHYVNMSSTSYTMVSCGFATTPGGSIWATQDFK